MTDRQLAVVPQPGQEEGDRDTVTPDRRKAVTPGRQKAVTPRRGRETIDNPCHIPMSAQETGGATPHNYRKARGVVPRVGHTRDGKKAASCSEGRKTTEGEYSNDPDFMLKPGHTAGNAAAHRGRSVAEPDEYNALSFSRAGGATAMSDPRSGQHNVYDHLCIDMDGNYSAVRIGKRNVVIDSNYDSVSY